MARVDLGSRETRIQLAVAISDATLQSLAAQEGQWQDSAHWDAAAARIRARRRLMLGHLTIREDALPTPDGLQCRDLLLGLLAESRRLDWLPWTDALQQLCRRQDLAHRHLGAPWPQRTPEALLATAEHWLGPVLIGCLRWQDLDPTTLENALWTDLEWGHRQQLETLLPRQVPPRTGRATTGSQTADRGRALMGLGALLFSTPHFSASSYSSGDSEEVSLCNVTRRRTCG